MNDNLDLAERLEQSFGDGPTLPLVDVHLRSGRRALLRRRLAAGAAALTVVAVVGTGFTLIGGGPDDDAAPAIDPAAPGASFDGVEEAPAGTKPAVVLKGDTLEVAADVNLIEVVKDPLDAEFADDSYGVAWDRGGKERWVLYFEGPVTSGEYGGSVADAPLAEFPTFEAWLDDTVERLESGTAGIGVADKVTAKDLQGVDLVRFGQGEELVVADDPSVFITEQTADVDLPDNFAGPDDRTAAAAVMSQEYGVVFVLAREIAGSEPEYIPYPFSDKTGISLDEFLTFAATQYEAEVGLR